MSDLADYKASRIVLLISIRAPIRRGCTKKACEVRGCDRRFTRSSELPAVGCEPGSGEGVKTTFAE